MPSSAVEKKVEMIIPNEVKETGRGSIIRCHF